MAFRKMLQFWLSEAVKSKIRETVVRAAGEQSSPGASLPPADESKVCHLGIVFALTIESGCTEDLLQGLLTIRANGFVLREGGLSGRRAVLILSGPGRNNAAHAAEVLIDGHRPAQVISAGFAGAICPALKRNDILVANRVVLCQPWIEPLGATAGLPSSASSTGGQATRGAHPSTIDEELIRSEGSEIAVDLPPGLSEALEQPGVHCGPLLTSDRVVRTPRERQLLFQRYGAMAVDMETFAVAAVCRQRGVPFSSIRAINDTADETLPRDVEHLLAQTSGAAQVGAALGAIWRRPASAKDLYRLRENALLASLRLAKFLAAISFK